MRVRATIVLEYDLLDDTLEVAFGTDDPAEVIQREQELMEGGNEEVDRGDYVMGALENADKIDVSVEQIEDFE